MEIATRRKFINTVTVSRTLLQRFVDTVGHDTQAFLRISRFFSNS